MISEYGVSRIQIADRQQAQDLLMTLLDPIQMSTASPKPAFCLGGVSKLTAVGAIRREAPKDGREW